MHMGSNYTYKFDQVEKIVYTVGQGITSLYFYTVFSIKVSLQTFASYGN